MLLRGSNLNPLNILHVKSASLSTAHCKRYYKTHIPYNKEYFAKLLIQQGFSVKQSHTVIDAMDDSLYEGITNTTNSLVSKIDQSKSIHTFQENLLQLKSDIQHAEKTNVDHIKATNESLKQQISQLRQLLQKEVIRSQAAVKLDLNLEKKRIERHSIQQHKTIQQTEQKIETEIKAARAQMKEIKMSILQYTMGAISGAGTLFLGFLYFSS
ncbi:hypothetical protein BDF14DRAFT_1778269 [Spinellus fusiger]|nr:hypothetical protein BDF14DRAFT_1778269 [Spinellus fusiger]